jgi:fumarylacetoacetase
MTHQINETHDPNLKSWVESANDPNTDFPIQNLPFCVYEFGDTEPVLGVGFIIGDKILDIYGCINDDLMQNEAIAQFASFRFWTLNAIGGFDARVLSDLRRQAGYLLSEKNQDRVAIAEHLYSIGDVRFEPAFKIGDYTDFYCSIYHATNVGSMFGRQPADAELQVLADRVSRAGVEHCRQRHGNHTTARTEPQRC